MAVAPVQSKQEEWEAYRKRHSQHDFLLYDQPSRLTNANGASNAG